MSIFIYNADETQCVRREDISAAKLIRNFKDQDGTKIVVAVILSSGEKANLDYLTIDDAKKVIKDLNKENFNYGEEK